MKYLNVSDAVDGGLILFGLTISLQDVQSILSIIIIILDVLWLVGKFIFKLIKYLKNDGKIDEEEKKDLFNDLNNIHKEIKNKEGD